MFTGTTSHSGALIGAIVLLTCAAIVRGGAAAADSNQDNQFLALLDKQGIPAVQGVPSLIETAHRVCRTLDAGMPADALVDAMVNDAYGIDPAAYQYSPDRLARTEARFIAAAVGAYCPQNQGKLAPAMANPAAYTHNAANSGSDPIRAVPSGDTTPNPQVPPAPPPTAHAMTPPLPIAAPTPPKRPPPPPQRPAQQAPPPPQQVEPPAVGPQPGGGAGSGGGGSAGGGANGGGGGGGTPGGGPAEPAPTDPTPGFVRLAP